MIKTKILTPTSDIHTVKEMVDIYKSLMRMITSTDETKLTCNAEHEWTRPGQGTWLATNAAQHLKGNIASNKLEKVLKAQPDNIQSSSTAIDDSHTRRSSRKARKKVVDPSFILY